MELMIPTRRQIEERLRPAFPPEQCGPLVDVLDLLRQIEIARAADTQDLKRGLAGLTQEVKALAAAQWRTDERLASLEKRVGKHFAELAAAQRRTDERLGELAAAQRRTDERVASLETRMDKRFAELAAAQRRTDERLGELAAAQQRTDERLGELAAAQQRTDERVGELAAAQRRTDERLGELAAAQRRTDERLGELAAAQQRTDERLGELAAAQRRTDESVVRLSQAVEKLSQGMDDLRQVVGSMINRFGFDLEEFVAALLPPWLERNYGVTDLSLERRHFRLEDGTTEEVDLVGIGRRDERPITVLAECRTSVGGGGVRQLATKLGAVAATIRDMPVARVIVAMNIHPSAEQAAAEAGIWLVPYSRINRERG